MIKQLTKSKRRVQTLYAYISLVNHKWVNIRAKKNKKSVSAFMDELIKEARLNHEENGRARSVDLDTL